MTDLLLVQLSDPHIGGAWPGVDPTASLGATLDELRRLPDAPDAVLVTGDLADSGLAAEYETVRALLAALGAPVYVLPGNHDDRDLMREYFDLPGAGDAPVQYAVDLGPMRLVVLDTTRPGEVRGELDRARLGWLDAELARAPAQITLLAMHHPPISTGIAAWDRIGLPAADRRALGEIVRRHRQVRRLVAGHVHQTIMAELAGCSALTAPSTSTQVRLDFHPAEIELVARPPGFVVHALAHGELFSHIRFVG
jgi:3',5'-cyclic AMP phosphodiesterase CpdA